MPIDRFLLRRISQWWNISIGSLTAMLPSFSKKYLVPAITAKWAEDIVDRARPQAGEEILDIACGTGVVARLASKRISRGHVTGLDMNKGMLAVARALPHEGAPIDWVEASALDLPVPGRSI